MRQWNQPKINPQDFERFGSLGAAVAHLSGDALLFLSWNGLLLRYPPPFRAASAACANWFRRLKNAVDWPTNKPVSVRNLTAPMAAP